MSSQADIQADVSDLADIGTAQNPDFHRERRSQSTQATPQALAAQAILGEPTYWWVLTFVFFLFMAAGAYFQGADNIMRGANDFAPVYAATTLVGTPDIYSPDKIHPIITRELGGSNPSWHFTRMPFHAALLWPLSLFAYKTAYAIYFVLRVAVVIAFMFLWRIPSRTYAVIFTLLSLPVFFSFLTGQDTLFLMLWIALAVHYQQRGKPFVAGVFFSLCAIKFHLFMFLPLLLIGQRRWRMFGGAASGGLALIAISFAAAGARWPLDYFETLTNPVINPTPQLMVNLHGLFIGVPGGTVMELASCLAVAVAVWLVMKKATFEEGLAVVLVGGLLTSYHTYTGDCVLLVPACSIIVSSMADRWTVPWVALAVSPILYLILVDTMWAYGVQAVIILLFCTSAAHLLRRTPEPAAVPLAAAATA